MPANPAAHSGLGPKKDGTSKQGAVHLAREQEGLLRTLSDKITELALNMEKMKLAEYVKLLDNPRRLLYLNFLAGLGRGAGIAVGFTILGAVVLYFLQMLVRLNLPLVGDFIAEIVRMVQLKLGP